jgi:hypothetical protein
MHYKTASIIEESLSQGEVLLRNVIYDARDELRELMERWDNSLTLEHLNILEKYRQGRLFIALHLNIAGYSGYACFSSEYAPHGVVSDLYVPDGHLSKGQSKDGHGRYNQMVFVNNVQMVESEQGIIPSSVWLYDILDEGDNIGRDSLYCSLSNGLYTFLPCLPKREIRVSRGSAAAQAHKLIGDVIETGAQVMDDIANNQGDFIRCLSGHFEHQGRFSCLRILLDVKTVSVRLSKCGEHVIELLDVLIGPFDL